MLENGKMEKYLTVISDNAQTNKQHNIYMT